MKEGRNLFLEQTMNRIDLSVSHSGDVRLGKTWRQENVQSPYSRLYYPYEGSGSLCFGNNEVIRMERGNVYLIPSGIKFSYACEEQMSKIYFHINVLKQDGYDIFFGMNRIGILPITEEKLLQLRNCYPRRDLSDIWMVKSILYETVAALLQQYPEQSRRLVVYSPMVQQTIDYIREHLSIQLTVGELAERMFVSKSFLGKHFREEVGVPPSEYVDDQIFFAAQWQLLRTERSIAEISEQFGFCDQFYFSRRFKQKYGETPNRYRQKIRAEKNELVK